MELLPQKGLKPLLREPILRQARFCTRSDRLYLVDIVEATDAITAFISDVDTEGFLNNDLVRSAVLHKLTIIGEAAACGSMLLRARFPETP
ncbi:MAG TPA: DUF86 domain-containing protein [Candidatus Competibacter phosphatis]|nr:DUF86 domain-containing protein [Candidatus Competibacter phosphatis]